MHNENADRPDLESEARSLDQVLAEIADGQRPRARAYCRKILGDEHAAEDCVQEALLRMRARAPDLDPTQGSLLGYFYRTLQRLALDELARRKRAPNMEVDEMTEDRSSPPTDLVLLAERADLVRHRLAMMDEKSREAFLMKERDGKSYREIAHAMGLHESHVGVLIHRTRLELLAGFKETS